MIDTRLALALGEGGLRLPETQRICALKPQVENKRSFLAGYDVEIVETFAPEVDAWRAAGREPAARRVSCRARTSTPSSSKSLATAAR